MVGFHRIAVILFCFLHAITALPIPQRDNGKYQLHTPEKITEPGQPYIYLPEPSLPTTIFKTWKPPQCKGPYSPSLYVTQSLYGFFIARRPSHRFTVPPQDKSTVSPLREEENSPLLPTYALANSLWDQERFVAPTVILFIMLWLALLIIGLVEFVGGLYERQAQKDKRKEYATLSTDFLEVVIEAVPFEGVNDGSSGNEHDTMRLE